MTVSRDEDVGMGNEQTKFDWEKRAGMRCSRGYQSQEERPNDQAQTSVDGLILAAKERDMMRDER